MAICGGHVERVVEALFLGDPYGFGYSFRQAHGGSGDRRGRGASTCHDTLHMLRPVEQERLECLSMTAAASRPGRTRALPQPQVDVALTGNEPRLPDC
jgi:hypothetical protein